MKVLMLGPARDVKGGMTSVVDSYYDCGLDKKVNLTYIETVNDKKSVSKIIKMIKGYFQFKKNINKNDVVHIHMASRLSSYRKGIYARIAKKQGKKLIVHIHGAEYKIFFEKECNNKQRNYLKKTLNIADDIIVLSEEWKEYFENLIEDASKIKIIYNAIYLPDDFEKDLDNNKMLFLGRFGKRKGIYDLIDVIEKLRTKYSDIELFAAGDGELKEVQEIIKTKKLEENIHILGWINGIEKEKYLRECSIYVLPSYNEGMPMSLIEGMAYKNVGVSTIVGGIPKVITNYENGIIIEPGNFDELYNALESLLINRKLKLQLSNNGRKTATERLKNLQ